ncbi:MAG: beta strand repeat-containing protein [Akkermansia sp.]
MKLHLPKSLVAAVLAAGLAVSAQAADYTVTCSGDSAITPSGVNSLSALTAADKVTINATQGYLNGATSTDGSETIRAKLVIQNLILTNGWKNVTHVFTGTITGDDDAQFRVDSRQYNSETGTVYPQTLTFQGDLSGYRGTIGQGRTSESTYNGLTLNFAVPSATNTVVARIENAQGTTNVQSDTVFTGSALAFGALTVDADKTMTIGGGTNSTTLNLTRAVTNNGTMLLKSGVTIDLTGMTPTSVSGEVIPTTGNAFSTGYLTYTLYTGNGLTVEEGASIAVTMNSRTLVESYDGSATVSANVNTTDYYINDGSAMWDATGATRIIVGATSVDFGTDARAVDLVINDGGSVTTTRADQGAGFVSGAITVNGGGTLNIDGHDALGYDTGATRSLTLSGSAEKTATLNLNTNTSITMTTQLVMTGNASIAGGTFNTYGCGITVSGTANTISSTMQVRSDATLTVSGEADTLLISGTLTRGNDSVGTLTKAGAGILTISGAINSITVNGANTTVYKGTSIGAADQTTTISGMRLAGEQRITLAGTVNIGNMGANDLSRSDNGYAFIGSGTINITGTVDVLHNSAGETTTHSKLGFSTGTVITVQRGASLTSGAIFNSSTSNTNNASVVVQSGGTLTVGGHESRIVKLTNAGSASFADGIKWMGELENNGGTLTLKGANAAIETMTLNGGTITLGSEESHNHTLSTNSLTLSADTTLNANLKLGVVDEDDSDSTTATPTTATVRIAKGASLTLGCTITLADTVRFVVTTPVSMDVVTTPVSMDPATWVTIADSVEDVLLSDGTTSVTGGSWKQMGSDKWYTYLSYDEATSTYTTGADEGQWALVYDRTVANNGQLMILGVPEPTSATLSLLALVGLAARRRRR